MPQTRRLLLLVIASLVGSAAVAEPPPLVVRSGITVGTSPTKGAVKATRLGRAPDYVRLGARLHATKPHIFSVSNANDRFLVWLTLRSLPRTRWPYLVALDTVFMATSTGSDSTGSTASFEVDRSEATRLAALWHVPMTERAPLDQGLVYAWRIDGEPKLGDPVPIVLRIENRGNQPVRVMMGGRQRGVRDNRFAFTATLDGEPLTVKEAPDFGGLSTNQRLAPGEHVEVGADLRAWVDVDRPGRLDISCQYEGELFPDNDDHGQWPDHAHETWQITVPGNLQLTL